MFELPIFPLNTVLFPGVPLSLHIFERRYQIMMKHVLETNKTFGVCLIRAGQEVYGPALPFPVGCTAQVLKAEPLGDEQMNLTVVGDERFRILRTWTSKPYLSAWVESIPLESHYSIDVLRGTTTLRQRVASYLVLLARMTGNEAESGLVDQDVDLTQLELPEDPMLLIYLAAALLQVPPVEKQPMLEANTAALLLQQVQRMYRRELALLPTLARVNEERAKRLAWNN
jgi:Lon protease-like protein